MDLSLLDILRRGEQEIAFFVLSFVSNSASSCTDSIVSELGLLLQWKVFLKQKRLNDT